MHVPLLKPPRQSSSSLLSPAGPPKPLPSAHSSASVSGDRRWLSASLLEAWAGAK